MKLTDQDPKDIEKEPLSVTVAEKEAPTEDTNPEAEVEATGEDEDEATIADVTEVTIPVKETIEATDLVKAIIQSETLNHIISVDRIYFNFNCS